MDDGGIGWVELEDGFVKFPRREVFFDAYNTRMGFFGHSYFETVSKQYNVINTIRDQEEIKG